MRPGRPRMCWTSFSDTTTPGRPRNTTKVRVVCDKANLYVAFDCKEFDCKELVGIKATATGQYDEADNWSSSAGSAARGRAWGRKRR